MVLAALVASGLVSAGCGRSSGDLAPVSGKVTLDGQPLPNVNVIFQPASDSTSGPTSGVGSIGATDTQGRYTLSTMSASPRKGAVRGPHNVSFELVPPARKPGETRTAPDPTLPPGVSKAKITFQVPPAGTHQADFDLKSK